MDDSVGIKLSKLNEFITCPVCHGYLIDATTVNECLHTFCKSCIVKHIKDNNNNECPKCNTVIHEHRPLDYILYDRSKQDIVYKLVPQLYISEMNRKLSVQGQLQDVDNLTIHSLENKFICVALVQKEDKDLHHLDHHFDIDNNTSSSSNSNSNSNNGHNKKNATQPPPPIYLRCPIDVKVRQIRKLLAVKYQLESNDRLVLFYKGDTLSDNDQVSNLAQSMSFVLHYEISRLYPTIEQASTSSCATSTNDSDKLSDVTN